MDVAVFRWINGHHCGFLDALLWGASASADFYLLWLALGAAAWAADRRSGGRALLGVLLALAFSYLAVDILAKPLAARPRPFAVLGGVRLLPATASLRVFRATWSFPSGHCASSAAAAWVLGSYLRRLRPLLALLVALVAYSRVYLGMHYPSDCLAGLAVGVLCGAAAVRISSRLAPPD